MATATALGLQVARRVRDADQTELTAAAYLDFINMAIDDLVGAGWLLPQAEDTSTTLAEDDFTYAVPSGFAYIRSLRYSDTGGGYPIQNVIPQYQWYVDNSANIQFYEDMFPFVAGQTLKIIGQKRPSQNVAGGDTITPGMESFIRERATYYAAEYLAAGDSALASYRQRMAEKMWAITNSLLGNHPMEFRVKPGAIHVPGR